MLENRTGSMQEQTWGKFHCTSLVGILCGCVVSVVLVVLVVKWVVKPSKHIPYSHYTFHHQNSQRVQTSSTLPTNLGKALANIIHCTCFFQHVWKQDGIHARTNMVKIALCKLFAGILCGCVVLLVLVVKWVKKPSRHIYNLTALSTNRFNKEFKQVLPYQPTSGKSLGQHNPLYLFLTACCKPEQKPCKNKHGENFIAQVVVGILCGCVVLVVLVVKWVKKPSKHIYILTALSTTRFNKEFKQVLPYQPTSGKSLGQHNPLFLFLSACCKPEQKPCKNKHGENFIAQVVVGILCGCVVLVVLVVKWVKKPPKHIYILTALSTTRFNKEFKQSFTVPGKTWPTSSTVRVSVSMLENRTGSMQETNMGKNSLHKFGWYSVWLCGVGWCWWCWWWSEWWNHPDIFIF